MGEINQWDLVLIYLLFLVPFAGFLFYVPLLLPLFMIRVLLVLFNYMLWKVSSINILNEYINKNAEIFFLLVITFKRISIGQFS